ncbi:hypothetical protein SAMN05421493_101650 [Pseudobutyrivibrio sp. 49]|uniref:hypothetical protein n=1 Tax=unclassified Pseudobutyrivibrio TaxID=2638619 RepID=UPI0008813D83|nr:MULTISPECIES: hypothetical protein [unclassified Pseudobutyrivibrio]SDH48174.1 hypothetical protein SAMN05421493_101650 [Pseudobutyrivibrio sp. 49]SFN41584.1 hypothetical protein SAMN04487831_10180 [Pseudobutyrivibrio sp. UC1225]
MKTNRIFLMISVLCFSLFATGCGEQLYEMTSEEEAIISLYASKAVAKFNKNQVIGIANARVKKGELDEDYEPDEEQADDEALEEADTGETIDPETGEVIPPEGEPGEDSEAQEGAEEQAQEDVSVEAGYSFTNAVDISGVEFTCSKFDVSSDFKTSSFYMKPASGKKYLTLYIDAVNTTDGTVDFSQYSGRTYSLSLNGGEKNKAQITMLPNDLSSYKGTMSGKEKKTFVIVFSFSNSAVENISSVELYVTSDGATRGAEVKPL